MLTVPEKIEEKSDINLIILRYASYLEWSIHQSTYMSYMGCGYVYEATQCNYDPAEDDYEEYIQVCILILLLHSTQCSNIFIWFLLIF